MTGKIIVFLFTIFTYSLYAEPQVSIDPQTGVLGDRFTLSISSDQSLDEDPQIPNVPHLQFFGSGTSTNMTFINGKFSKSVTYSFEINPQAPGKYTIPSFNLKVDGKTFATKPLVFEVTEDNSAPPTSHAQRPQSQAENNDEQSEAAVAFVTRAFAKRSLYVGEPVHVTSKVYYRYQITEASALSKTTGDLRSFEIGKKEGQEELGGQIYNVIELQDIAVPQLSGETKILPYQVQVSMAIPRPRARRSNRDIFSEFFDAARPQVITKTLASKPDTLTIKPIPLEGRPKSFSGIVGSYTLSANLSTDRLKKGETTTLTIIIKGSGLLDSTGLELPLPSHIKVYADKPEGKEKATADGIYSQKTFKFALVPTQEGTVNLGNFQIAFFDPHKEKFIELSQDLGTIFVENNPDEKNVIASSTGSSSNNTQTSVSAINQDMIDIHRKVVVSNQNISSQEINIFLIIVAMLSLLNLAAIFFARFKRSASVEKERRSQALKKFNKDKQKALSSNADISSQAKELYQSFKEYLGNKRNITGQALTTKDILQYCAELGVDETIQQEMQKILTQFDKIVFGGLNPTPDMIQKFSEKLDHLVKMIEKKA